MAKRAKFEEAMGIPEDERLKVVIGYKISCKREPRVNILHHIDFLFLRYNMKEYCWHGEAASVNLAAVAAEHQRISKIHTKRPVEYGWKWTVWIVGNRETSYYSSDILFYNAPPDRGLASKQMSGKKSNRFCITVAFACNADGSEKWPIFYIGKAKQPRCFGKKTPASYGFYYCNNKTAWMTSAYFEESVFLLLCSTSCLFCTQGGSNFKTCSSKVKIGT